MIEKRPCAVHPVYISTEKLTRLKDLLSRITKGTWRKVALGGASAVITEGTPGRNDDRIPPYGYDERNGYSLSYPFIEDFGRVRWDFTCFSHDDARFIAEAKENFHSLIEAAEACNSLVAALRSPGCLVFLDGVNEHGFHVLPSYPTNIPQAFHSDIETASRDIFEEAKKLGYGPGDHVWVEFRHIKSRYGDFGRVETPEHYEFVGIQTTVSRLLSNDVETSR